MNKSVLHGGPGYCSSSSYHHGTIGPQKLAAHSTTKSYVCMWYSTVIDTLNTVTPVWECIQGSHKHLYSDVGGSTCLDFGMPCSEAIEVTGVDVIVSIPELYRFVCERLVSPA